MNEDLGEKKYIQKYKYSYLDGRIVIVQVTVINSNVSDVKRTKLPEIKVDLLEQKHKALEREYEDLLTYNHSQRTKKKRALYKQKIKDVQGRLSQNKKLIEFERKLVIEMKDEASGDEHEGSDEDEPSSNDDD